MDKIDLEVTIFKALAHPVRLKIIKILIKGESCVCKLQDYTDFSQSNLSQHLNLLRSAGLIKPKKKGLFTFYEISNKNIVKIINIVEKINIENLENMLGV